MTYRVYDQASAQALGVSFDDLLRQGAALLGKASPTLGVAAKVATDPYFPELTCHLIRLSNVSDGLAPGVCARTRPGLRGGIGLEDAILPVRAFVAHKQRPWLLPAIAVVLLGGTFAIGYLAGKGKI